MALKLITPPATDPISLTTMKQHLREVSTDWNIIIQAYMDAAVSYLDGPTGILGQALITQQWELYYDAFPCDGMQIPLGPLQSVQSVQYIDASGDYVTWPNTNYKVDTVSNPGWVVPINDWPTAQDTVNAVKVAFTCGFGGATSIPSAILVAIMQMVAHWFENRETVSVGNIANEMPLTSMALIAPFRRNIL
jgi:uncharacterized phiE125 gp8 family phage protein